MNKHRLKEINTHKAKQIVEKVLKENQLQDVIFYNKIINNWAVIVGKPLASKTSPSKLQHKSLWVMVEDAAYAQHLRYFEEKILELIASPEICGEGNVKRIIFRVGEIKTTIKKVSEVPNKKIEHIIPDKIQETADACAQKIQDQDLRRRFSKMMAKTISKKSIHET